MGPPHTSSAPPATAAPTSASTVARSSGEASGPISETGQIVNKRLIDPWFYASGLPISDAYWTRVKIAGAYQDVMIQAYERRVLTYVPTNVPGFQVEMGNIGLHYYDWRYKDAGQPSVTATVVQTTTVQPTTTPPGTPGTPAPTATGPAGTATPTVTGTPPTATPTASPTVNVISQGVIAFMSKRDGSEDIWRVKGDGTQPTKLNENPADDDWPVYSPDFTKIAFVSNRDNNDEIYVMNADGTGVTRLTSNNAPDYAPSWSPDGSRIVFVSERDNSTGDIFVMQSSGTGQVRITVDPAPDVEPSWGANDRIVFTSNRSGTNQIYTVNPDGSGLFGPLTTAGANYQPKWNTLGNRITFVSDRDGNPEIYTMRQGGEEQFRLTNNTFPDFWPAYAPNNSKIVFVSDRGDPAFPNTELYTMNIDGSNQERITIHQALEDHPSWGLQTSR